MPSQDYLKKLSKKAVTLLPEYASADVSLSSSQEFVARLHGYPSWHAVTSENKNNRNPGHVALGPQGVHKIVEGPSGDFDLGTAQRAIPAGQKVLRFRIELNIIDERSILDTGRPGASFKITRLLEVPIVGTFFDLHCAFQDVMGWTNSHLHEFQVYTTAKRYTRVGMPYEFDVEPEKLHDERRTRLSDHLDKMKKQPMVYLYDFGDSWAHTVFLEAELCSDGGLYPRCITGSNACPAEDCGGTTRYLRLIDDLLDTESEAHKEKMGWYRSTTGIRGRPKFFDFDPQAVRFGDPQRYIDLEGEFE